MIPCFHWEIKKYKYKKKLVAGHLFMWWPVLVFIVIRIGRQTHARLWVKRYLNQSFLNKSIGIISCLMTERNQNEMKKELPLVKWVPLIQRPCMCASVKVINMFGWKKGLIVQPFLGSLHVSFLPLAFQRCCAQERICKHNLSLILTHTIRVCQSLHHTCVIKTTLERDWHQLHDAVNLMTLTRKANKSDHRGSHHYPEIHSH